MSSADYRVTLLLMARDELSKAVNAAKNAVKDFANTTQQEAKKVQSTWSKLAGDLNDVLKIAFGVSIAGLAAEATRSIISFAQESVKAFADLEYRSKRLAALSREAGQDIEKLAKDYMDAAIRSARQFGVSIKESSMAFDSLVRAGLSGAEAMNALNAVLAISQIEGVNAAQVADILVATLNQFSLSAQDAWRVADALTNAAAIGVSTMTQYANGLSYVGAVANQLGFSLEETLAALVAIDASIKDAAKSGRYLQAALSALVEKSDKLGFSIYDSNGKMLDMVEILTRLYEHYKSLATEQERNTYLFRIFGEQGARAVAALFSYVEKHGGNVRQVFSELVGEIGKVGTALETAQKVMDTTAGKLAQMNERIEEAKIALGEMLAPAVIEVANSLIVLSDVIAALNGDLNRLSKDHLSMLAKQLENVAAYNVGMFGLGGAFKYLWENVLHVNDIAEEYAKKMEEVNKEIKEVDERLVRQAQSYQDLIRSQSEANKAQEQYQQVLEESNRTLKEAIDTSLEYSNLVEKIAREFNLPIEKVDQLARGLLGLNFVYDEHASLKDMLINKYGIEAEKADAFIQALEEEARAHEEAGGKAREHAACLDELRSRMLEAAGAVVNYGMVTGPLADSLGRLKEAMNEMIRAGGEIPRVVREAYDYFSGLNEQIANAERAMRGLRAASELAGLSISYYNAMLSVGRALVADEIQMIDEEIQKRKEQIESYQQMIEQFPYWREHYRGAIEQLRQEITELENRKKEIEASISLTAEQIATQERLKAIQDVLSFTTQQLSLMQTALQLAMMGAGETANTFMGAIMALIEAQMDGIVTEEEFKNILQLLGIQFDETGRPVMNFTSILQKFREELENNISKVQSFRDELAKLNGMTIHTYHYHHEITVKEGGGGGGGKKEETTWNAPWAPPAQHGEWFTREGLYYLHRGEMILPKDVAEYVRRGSGFGGIVIHAPVRIEVHGSLIGHDLDKLSEEISRSIVRKIRMIG